MMLCALKLKVSVIFEFANGIMYGRAKFDLLRVRVLYAA
jgi:hypothetical protein